jgi:hypothetical protein
MVTDGQFEALVVRGHEPGCAPDRILVSRRFDDWYPAEQWLVGEALKNQHARLTLIVVDLEADRCLKRAEWWDRSDEEDT